MSKSDLKRSFVDDRYTDASTSIYPGNDMFHADVYVRKLDHIEWSIALGFLIIVSPNRAESVEEPRSLVQYFFML